MPYRAARYFLFLGFAAIALLYSPESARAEFSLYEKNGLTAGLSLDLGAGIFSADTTDFGGNPDAENTGWSEGYVKPIFKASYDTGQAGLFYGELSYVGSRTFGDGDVFGFTDGDSKGWESERAYVGWRSGTVLSALGEDALDISIGEQDFSIGDGFLIMDGQFDFDDGAYWLAPHSSFDQAAVVNIDTAPVRSDLFYLKADDDQGDTELYGANVEYVSEKLGTLGASWMTITDSDFATREGMDVYSVRGQGTPFANLGLSDLFLSAEFVHEGGGDEVDIDAQGWYAEAGYTFSHCPWSPTLSYRYAFFSGDETDTDDYEAFDPLFYGFSRGWGTYYMGEIVGEYYLFNSNEQVHMVHLNTLPTEKLSAGALYYDFSLDEAPAGVDDHFAREVNLYADYAASDNLYLTAVFAYATPEEAAEERFNGDQDMKLFEIGAFLTF